MNTLKSLSTNIKRVLLCDAGFSALPILHGLQSRGLWVAVCGARPEDPGHSLANASFVFDYSDSELLQECIKQHNIDYLVPGCTDISYSSCAKVAKNLDLPGYDDPSTAELIANKHLFRNLSKVNHYPIPKFTSNLLSYKHLNFPTLLKPIDSFSGRGIQYFESARSWELFLEKNQSSLAPDQWILEECIKGDLYSHSAFLSNGKIIQDFFVREFCTVYPYQVNSSYLCSSRSTVVAAQMRAWAEKLAQDISLTNGLLHTQFINSGENAYLIEGCRRCPGDLYSLLIEKSCGFNYASWFSMPFTNQPYPIDELNNTKSSQQWISRHTASALQQGKLASVTLSGHYQQIEYVPVKHLGQLVPAAPMDRAGIYFLSHETEQLMTELTPGLAKHVQLNFFP
jgi:hypothetical protein